MGFKFHYYGPEDKRDGANVAALEVLGYKDNSWVEILRVYYRTDCSVPNRHRTGTDTPAYFQVVTAGVCAGKEDDFWVPETL